MCEGVHCAVIDGIPNALERGAKEMVGALQRDLEGQGFEFGILAEKRDCIVTGICDCLHDEVHGIVMDALF